MDTAKQAADDLRARVYAEVRRYYGAIGEIRVLLEERGHSYSREHISRVLRGRETTNPEIMDAAVTVLERKKQADTNWVHRACAILGDRLAPRRSRKQQRSDTAPTTPINNAVRNSLNDGAAASIP